MHQIQARRNTLSQNLFKLALYVPFITICGTIFWLSSLSHPPVPAYMKFQHGDKVMHVVAFFFVGLTAVLPVALNKKFFKLSLAIRAFSLAALYAALDEFHQMFVPRRDSSSLDFGADLLGATLGICAFWLVMAIFKSRKNKKAPKT